VFNDKSRLLNKKSLRRLTVLDLLCTTFQLHSLYIMLLQFQLIGIING